MGKRLLPLTHKAFLFMEEIFKDIPGYEGMYQVSNLGNVKSLSRKMNKGKIIFISKEKLLKLSKDGRGYIQVNLSKDKKILNKKVHQLVAMAFLNHIPDGTTKLVVDHIDNNPLNNRVDNLQVITNRHNISKDRKNGTSKYTGVYFEKSRNKYICGIRFNNKIYFHKRFNTELEAHKAYQNKLAEIQ